MNSLPLQPSLCTILHHSQQIRTGAATFMIVVSSIYLHKHWFILGATVVPVDCCLAAESRGFDSQGCECACFVLLRDSGFLPQSRDIRQTGHWAPMARLQLLSWDSRSPLWSRVKRSSVREWMDGRVFLFTENSILTNGDSGGERNMAWYKNWIACLKGLYAHVTHPEMGWPLLFYFVG